MKWRPYWDVGGGSTRMSETTDLNNEKKRKRRRVDDWPNSFGSGKGADWGGKKGRGKNKGERVVTQRERGREKTPGGDQREAMKGGPKKKGGEGNRRQKEV